MRTELLSKLLMSKSSSAAAVAEIDAPDYGAMALSELKFETFEAEAVNHQLPIGIFKDGQRLQEYSLHPYTGSIHMEHAAIARKYQGAPAEVLPRLLAIAVESIGGHDVKKLANDMGCNLKRFFDQMSLSDALAILLQIKINDCGAHTHIAAKCPACQFENKDSDDEPTDVSTTEVNMAVNMDTNFFRVDLKRGAKIMGDKIDHVIMRPLRVYDLIRFEKRRKQGSLTPDFELLLHTIVDIPQASVLSKSKNADRSGIAIGGIEDFLRELTPQDLAILNPKAIKKIGELGPRMTIDMVCQNCGNKDWEAEVPWMSTHTFLSWVAPEGEA